jgi:hypothetical protein
MMMIHIRIKDFLSILFLCQGCESEGLFCFIKIIFSLERRYLKLILAMTFL